MPPRCFPASCAAPGTGSVDEVSSEGWTMGTGGPGATPALPAPPEALPFFALRDRVALAAPALAPLGLGVPGLAVAGLPEEGPALPSAPALLSAEVSFDPLLAGGLVLFFCAQGGRFGSSCALTGRIATHSIAHTQSGARKYPSLRCKAEARKQGFG